MAFGDSSAESHALSAGTHGVRGVLDIGSRDVCAASGRECHGADAEVAIRAVSGGFGGDGVALEVVQLLDCKPKGCSGCFKVLHVDA